MTSAPYYLHMPQGPVGRFVFASPHSGCNYEPAFLARSELDPLSLRSSEDAFVDQLFDCVPSFGAPLLCAVAPRAYVDLNRALDELDPALIRNLHRVSHNPRVASGLGVVPRVVAQGRAIYRGKMSMEEVQERLDQIWLPYHTRLQSLLTQALRSHNESILIDCHSMPHEAVRGSARSNAPRAEVVLGDRFGAAARPEIVERIEAAFVNAGFRVARNTPFAGAFSVQHYGRPSRAQHAIQIEIDRGLYMDEARVEPHAGFDGLRRALRGVVAEITGHTAEDGASDGKSLDGGLAAE